MKLKKLLASILCIAMVLSTMGFAAFAEAKVYEVASDAELAEALKSAVDYDIIKLAAGEYTGGISVGKNITFEGSVDADGNPTTVFSGENNANDYYCYSIYMNKGTIKNIKIINAWKGIMTEGIGSLTIDNVTMEKIGYGIHIAEAKNAEDTVTIQNSNIDVTWACSFAGGPYALVITNNVFTSIDPYYTNGTGSPVVNSLVENTTVEDNYFGENAKVAVRADFEIGTNFYEDGVENALHYWSEEDATVDKYYADEEMTEVKTTPKGTLNSCRVNDADATRTFITTELNTVYAEKSIKLEILDADGNVLATTLSTDKVFEDITFPKGSFSIFTGINSTDDYWTTTWASQKLRGDIEPNKAVLYVDDIKTSEIDFAMKGAISNKDIVWSEVPGVFNPNINGTYLGGSYDNAYLCVEVYDFYLGETFEVKYFSNDEHIATASLKEGMLPSGARDSIGCCLGFNGDFDEYWKTEWLVPANAEQIPDKVEVYVDDVKIAEKEGSFGNYIKGWDPESNGNWLYELINEDWIKINGVHTVAKVGEKGYATIQAAVNAATDGDVVTILPGIYDESFMVNQLEGVNVTITAENKGDVTLTGTITVNGNRRYTDETLNIENLVFDGTDKTAAHDFIKDLDKYNGVKNNPSYAHNVTIKNCDFIGNGDYENAAVVAFRESKAGTSNIVIDGCTATKLHSLAQVSGSKKITVTNTEIIDCQSGMTTNASANVIFTNNTVDVDEFAVRTGQKTNEKYDATNITFDNNMIEAGISALALRNVVSTVAMAGNTIVAPAVFTLDDADDSTINDVSVIAKNIIEKIGETNVVIPAAINVVFEETDNEDIYNIVLTADDDIYEFVGAELTFKNTSKTAAGEDMQYEILGIAGITDVDDNTGKADTYALRLVDNVLNDGVNEMSGKKLVIGQVKFFGQGTINFNVAKGTVVTTEYNTYLEKYYVNDGDDDANDGDSLIIGLGIDGGEVTVKAGTVKVNIAYNHVLDGTYWDDNQITVSLKDGFGEPVEATADSNDRYVEFNDVRVGKIIVTLEAPGFRKTVYQTNIDEDGQVVELNFWNEVKRNTDQSPLAEIEEGKGLEEKNFLVGDIVMDYIVDEYDLAAVTSYYGTYDLTDAAKYIKYDLNRDGNIDIIDVAYVLHSYAE